MKKKLLSKSLLFKLRASTAVLFLLTGAAAVLLAAITTAPAVGTAVNDVNMVPTGATPTPTPCSWLFGQALPSVGVRSTGVFYSGNFNHSRTPSPMHLPVAGATPPFPAGKFFAMGGRSSDSAGSDFLHPFQYTPLLNSWTTQSATYPDNQVSNMACGVLNVNGADFIYCVGGSAGGATTATDRVFRYDPVTDTITTIAAPWPGAMGTILPGGFAVFNNKLYILGGFNINVGMVDTIWEFTPSPPAWVQKSAHLPTPLGYIPTATLHDSLIATGGGSTFDGTTLHDSTFSFSYDPVADTIQTIAPIPRATSETRGLNFCNMMYVMGGGRDAPNPSNEVDIYDPVSNSWSLGQPFAHARRDFATDTDGGQRIWVAGGYDVAGSPTDSMEVFNCVRNLCPPTPFPTPTVSVTPTPTARPTQTPRVTATPRTTPTPRRTP
jgi:hypothetical protein